MTPQEIIKGNQLLAEFMGYVNTTPADPDFNIYENSSGEMLEAMSMQYHSSWDWLMEVVNRVEFFSGHLVEIELTSCTIKNIDLTWVHTSQGTSKIEAVWLACLSFIKWYNQNKEK